MSKPFRLPQMPCVQVPTILLPKSGTDSKKWAVIACDQYTSEEDYWEKVKQEVGDAPSTLNLIFPEVYLEKGKDAEVINKIQSSMQEYEQKGVLEATSEPSMVLLQRTCKGRTRTGVLVALDLEAYDHSPGSQALIRATEKTIIDRIPPRLKIRRQAPVELPHILVLIDDPNRTVIEPLLGAAQSGDKEMEKIYDFDLMMSGGHLTGYRFSSPDKLEAFGSALKQLACPDVFANKYGLSEDQKTSLKPLLFAMGDGNHSLATAKALWEETKPSLSEEEKEDHLARFALVELENIHDEALEFEPIHRLIYKTPNADVQSCFLDPLVNHFTQLGCGPVTVKMEEEAFTLATASQVKEEGHSFGVVFGGKRGAVTIGKPNKVLCVASVMDFVDKWMGDIQKPSKEIDYVHGLTAIDRFCGEGNTEGNVGLVLPGMEKGDLFKTVVLDGVLPRKTFSMGEADEKRFYYEARRITSKL